MIKITEQNRKIWQTLYQMAGKFRDARPWQHYDDNFIFGIQDPQSDIVGWCVIMGNGGEIFGLNIFLGDEGLDKYEEIVSEFEDIDEDEAIRTTEITLGQKCFKVEFVDRDETDDEDRKLFKNLGLKFKGRNNYISVRKFDPGWFPWYINDKQALFITQCLTLSLNLVEVSLEGRLKITEFYDDRLLVLVPQQDDGTLAWEPDYWEWPEYEPDDKLVADPFIVNRIKKELKKREKYYFLSFQYLLSPIQENKGERPYFPKAAFWIEGESGLITDNKLFSPVDLWKDFQSHLLDTFLHMGYIPAQIGVDSHYGLDMLTVYGELLDIQIAYIPDHPLFQDLYESMGDKFI